VDEVVPMQMGERRCQQPPDPHTLGDGQPAQSLLFNAECARGV
jgi:hypothetical protein